MEKLIQDKTNKNRSHNYDNKVKPRIKKFPSRTFE